MASVLSSVRRGRAFPENVGANSIPPKSDDLPPPRLKKNDGFGFSQSRLAGEADATPGPGAYYKPGSFERNSDSLSKKGLGNGFVSKSKRFGGARKKDRTPGPGEHQTLQAPPSKKDFAARSATFAPPVKDAINRKAPEPAPPGPGAYSPPSTLVTSVDAARSAFTSKTERFQFQASPTPLGPGQYDAALPTKAAPSYASAFKSNEPRGFEHSGSYGPGPGEYISQGSLLKEKAPVHPSSVLPPEKSRAPRSEIRRKEPLPLPGPGTYDATEAPMMKSGPAMVSAFKSTTTRDKDQLVDRIPLGPGAYQVAPPAPKESFIFNRDQKWI